MSRNPVIDMPKSQMYRDMMALGFYHLDGITLVRGEMRAYQRGFQELLGWIDTARDGWWPLTCSTQELERWEYALRLPPRPRASLQRRRETVRELLALNGEGRTPAGAEAALLAAGIRGKITEDWREQRLTVLVEEFGEEYDSIYSCMERARELLPAHMTVVFEFGGPDWVGWEGMYGSWEVFDSIDQTWQERDAG